MCSVIAPCFFHLVLAFTALHAATNPRAAHAELACEQNLHLLCSFFSLVSAHLCSVPAQPATALQCSADPLSAQAGARADQERAFAAVAAANRRGGGSESVLDALEAAESQNQAASAHSGGGASTASAEGQQQERISPGAMHADPEDACFFFFFFCPHAAWAGAHSPMQAPRTGVASRSHARCRDGGHCA